MKNKQKVIFMILGILIGFGIGMLILKIREENHKDEFQKEKMSILQKAKEKELALGCTIDSLKTEIVYLKASEIFSNAHSLSDLSIIAKLLHSHEAGFDSYGFMRKFHPDVFHELWTLGQKFFVSEVRTISSRKELESFEERYKLIGNIVPIYNLDLGGKTFTTYYEKINQFRK